MYDAREHIGDVRINYSNTLVFELVSRHGVRSMRVSRSTLIKGKWSRPVFLFNVPYILPVDYGTKTIEPYNDLMNMLNVITEKLPTFKLEE